MIRYKEFWGNQPGENDELLINGLEPVHAGAVPVGKRGERVLRVRLGRQEESTLERRTGAQQAAVHPGRAGVHPGSRTADAIVSYQLKSRGGGPLRTLNVPNWEGANNQIADLLERLRQPQVLRRRHGAGYPAFLG